MTYTNEDILQSDCWKWLWNNHPVTRRCCWHVPNGGKRIIKEAAKFKAMGVLAGVSDIHFIWASQLYIIELKVGVNHITDAQEQYIRAATKQGAIFYECRSLEKFKEIMTRIIILKEPMQCEACKLVQYEKGKWKVAA
jgi:hypothetical protein